MDCLSQAIMASDATWLKSWFRCRQYSNSLAQTYCTCAARMYRGHPNAHRYVCRRVNRQVCRRVHRCVHGRVLTHCHLLERPKVLHKQVCVCREKPHDLGLTHVLTYHRRTGRRQPRRPPGKAIQKIDMCVDMSVSHVCAHVFRPVCGRAPDPSMTCARARQR